MQDMLLTHDVLNDDRSIFLILEQLLNIDSISVHMLVSKECKSNDISWLQRRNILFIDTTLDVSKLLVITSSKLEHPENILFMKATFEVSKEDRSSLVMDEHSENIDLMSVTFLVLNEEKFKSTSL